MEYLKKLLTAVIGLSIWLGPCIYFDEIWPGFFSWLPALFIMLYLDDD